MNKKEEKNKKLNRLQLIEVAVASFLTVVILVISSVYAWFRISNSLETMAKVKQPDNLDIRAGNFQAIVNFDLQNIDIDDMAKNGYAEYRVFSVSAGDYKIAYRLQLAHTTNIPFKYTLYSATWLKNATGQNAEGSYVEYHPLNDDSVISYYQLAETPITLNKINPDTANESAYGRTIALHSGTYYDKTYEDENDDPEIYAVPMYLQTNAITPVDNSNGEHDYYVLKIEWDSEAANRGFKTWNKAENNKETDIICITASRITN